MHAPDQEKAPIGSLMHLENAEMDKEHASHAPQELQEVINGPMEQLENQFEQKREHYEVTAQKNVIMAKKDERQAGTDRSGSLAQDEPRSSQTPNKSDLEDPGR